MNQHIARIQLPQAFQPVSDGVLSLLATMYWGQQVKTSGGFGIECGIVRMDDDAYRIDCRMLGKAANCMPEQGDAAEGAILFGDAVTGPDAPSTGNDECDRFHQPFPVIAAASWR